MANFFIQGTDSGSELSAFAYDARRFVMSNMSIMAQAPLQIYCSTLVFAPSKSLVRQRLSRELSPWLRRLDESGEGWNANLLTIENSTTSVTELAFSPDGKVLACGAQSGIRLWDPFTGTSRGAFGTSAFRPDVMSFSQDGRFLFYSCRKEKKGLVGCWDVALQAVLGLHQCPRAFGETQAFSPNGEILAAQLSLEKVALFDTSTMESRFSIAMGSWVCRVTFSPNGHILAVVARSHIELWDFSAGRREVDLTGTYGAEEVGCFSPDGKLFAFKSVDRDIVLWLVEERVVRNRWTGPRTIQGLFFSHDGCLLVAYCGECIVWDVSTGTCGHLIPDNDSALTFFRRCGQQAHYLPRDQGRVA
jgi:WD40 repeat protein